MSINPPAPPVKKGMGCCGCGCLVLAILAALFLALAGTMAYLGFKGLMKLTTDTPPSIPTFDGGGEVYDKTMQKLNDFKHDVQNHQPASISLSSDEINTLIARNPDFANKGMHLFVTLNDDTARVQGSLPLSIFHLGLPNRYLSSDATFNVDFDTDTKSLRLSFVSLQLGSQDVPKDDLPIAESEINPALNKASLGNTEFHDALIEAKTIQIKDGELVIETE